MSMRKYKCVECRRDFVQAPQPNRTCTKCKREREDKLGAALDRMRAGV